MILVGSRYFFGKYPDFKSKDADYVLLVDNPKGFRNVRQTSGSYCLFEWRRMTPAEYIAYALSKGPAMQLGKFLVPEFCKEVGFTVEHLKSLSPLLEKLDEKHAYEKAIYEAYIKNGDFVLTDSQREVAYGIYKEARKDEQQENPVHE